MMPIVQAIIGDIFPPAERGKGQGLLMAVFGLSSIVGPTPGGWLAPVVEATIKQAFAAVGPQGLTLFDQLLHAMRISLAGAITDIVVDTAGLMLLALLATLVLREIPLRKSNAPSAPADGAAREEAAR
jgi:MFS family permease